MRVLDSREAAWLRGDVIVASRTATVSEHEVPRTMVLARVALAVVSAVLVVSNKFTHGLHSRLGPPAKLPPS